MKNNSGYPTVKLEAEVMSSKYKKLHPGTVGPVSVGSLDIHKKTVNLIDIRE